ncbi:MAG: hypothetical protein ABIX28_13840 [Vicinamibacterales bacterium]
MAPCHLDPAIQPLGCARGASDLNPIETTQRQAAVPGTYDTRWWNTGPNPTYKIGDQWVISDRLLLDVQYAHIGNNFILNFHEDDLATVQPVLIVGTGLNLRSGSQSVNIRPVDSVNVNANYFLPGKLFGDHAFKLGGYWRDARSTTISHTGGNATARFPNQAAYDTNTCATGTAAGCAVALTRDGYSAYDLTNISIYAQDSLSHQRFSFNLGIRYDRNHDQVLAADIPANPILPALLPAVSFGGVDPGIVFNNFSPRLGVTYDVFGTGKTILRGNYARYYGQVGTGGVASQVNPVNTVTVRYPWVDLNGDRFVQAAEVQPTNGNFANFQARAGNWDASNPTAVGTKNHIDPDLKNDTTDELIIGGSREIGRGFAIDASYIWRRYDNFQSTFTDGVTSADYLSQTFTPTCTVAGARCDAVTAYYPSFQLGSITTLLNTPNFTRSYNGFELTARKRMANHWMMNSSVSYNSIIANYGDGSYQNPNNIDKRNGFQYDYATAGSGIGNVYVNAKWLYKLSGMYQLPYQFNVSAFYNARQGYPNETGIILTTALPNGGGTPTLLLDPIGENRLPTFQNLDFHLERPISFGAGHFVPSIDVFNLTNNDTIQAIRGNQNATNANQIQAIVAPRIVRFGLRVNW